MPAPFGPEHGDHLARPDPDLEVEPEGVALDDDVPRHGAHPEAPVRSQRSRSPTRTSTETASSTRLSTTASAGSPSSAGVDRQRQGLRDALEVAGEGDGGAELAEGARERQHGTGHERRRDQRQGHAAEHLDAARTERDGGLLELAVEAAQGALDGDHQERHGDEHLGHHDPRVVNGK